ncbi:MAG: GNAT family N-acetyltransferase [Clostridia bacterium]|nr:GNAT family N-acetyltransferase [Clostridia bacterium]
MNKLLNEITNIRTLEKADLETAKLLWLASFPDDDAVFVDYYFRARTSPEKMLGLFVSDGESEEKLVSMLCFEELFMRVSMEKSARVAFVAGVCTFPEYRRRGYVRRLLSELEARLAPLGFEAMVLQPFDFAFYEKLGFKAFAVRNICSLKSGEGWLVDPFWAGECCSPKITGENAETMPLDADALYRIYGAYTESLCGTLLRSREKCAAVLEEYAVCGGSSLAVKTASGEAYALWYGGETDENADDGADEGKDESKDESKDKIADDGAEKAPVRLDEFAYTSRDAASELILRILDEAGAVKLPLPMGAEPFFGENAAAPFNMLKPIGERRFEEFFGENEPFDFQRY